ncbi:LppU/SCO3897 family protein [Streptomyces sp. H49]|uniref:LppU/SCO3897 family protein n=1 Tax=Streptomyces sp. H49 TaxID=3444117 RepID=UPI003F4A9FA3
MSVDRPVPIDIATLTLGDRLGQGGQGTVHQVRNKRINRGIADGDWEVVYKEYSTAVLQALDTAALESAVALLSRLSDRDGRWLCDKTAWPAVVVHRQGRACGFLMRAVPDRFRFTLRSLTAVSPAQRRLATVEFLLNDDAYVTGIGLTVGDRDRLLLLADLATTLHRLHAFDVTVGDVSPKNLLFTLTPRPECFLIDSDAMRLRGASVLPQAETPDWQVPPGEERGTAASDVYKLGLLAVRLFARDQTTTDPAALARTGARLGDLARASLDPDPARRPSPASWAEELTAVAATTTNQPKKHQQKQKPKPTRQRTGPAGVGRGSGRPGGAGAGRTAGPGISPGTTAAGLKRALGTLAAVAALVAVVAGGHQLHSRAEVVRDAHGPTLSSPPFPDPFGTSPDPADDTAGNLDDPYDDSGDGTSTDPADPAPDTPSATPTDPIGTAEVGDCFDDHGGSEQADLSPADCAAGTFRVARIKTGTTDLDSCDGVTDSDESVSSAAYDRVLCLSYQSSGGSAFHAHQGDCVFGAPGAEEWSRQSCRTGTFKVLAAYRGTTSHAKCEGLPHYNYWRSMKVAGNSALDVMLCLSMNYPDDAGYAVRNECLVKSGNTFTNVGDCGKSNVYVTGRTSAYRDASFCGSDGYTTWPSTDYPAFAYTVCWRWR